MADRKNPWPYDAEMESAACSGPFSDAKDCPVHAPGPATCGNREPHKAHLYDLAMDSFPDGRRTAVGRCYGIPGPAQQPAEQRDDTLVDDERELHAAVSALYRMNPAPGKHVVTIPSDPHGQWEYEWQDAALRKPPVDRDALRGLIANIVEPHIYTHPHDPHTVRRSAAFNIAGEILAVLEREGRPPVDRDELREKIAEALYSGDPIWSALPLQHGHSETVCVPWAQLAEPYRYHGRKARHLKEADGIMALLEREGRL